jgi:hypothetical protein
MGDVSKLTKKEICAISFRFFGTLYKEANPKPVLVSGLVGLMGEQPDVLATAGAPAAAALPLPCPPFLLRRRRRRWRWTRRKSTKTKAKTVSKPGAY